MNALGSEGEGPESGMLMTHCLVQFGAFLAVPNPLGGQLVPGVNKRNTVLIISGNDTLNQKNY